MAAASLAVVGLHLVLALLSGSATGEVCGGLRNIRMTLLCKAIAELMADCDLFQWRLRCARLVLGR